MEAGTTAGTVDLQQKTYYYYPAYGRITEKRTITTKDGSKEIDKVLHSNYARRVLAGIVSNGQLHVAEAVCFMGNTEKPEPDQFNKAKGRQIAEGRVWRSINRTAKQVETAVFVVKVPSDVTTLGKFFVQEVEKRFPKHVGRVKNKKAKTETEQTQPASGDTVTAS